MLRLSKLFLLTFTAGLLLQCNERQDLSFEPSTEDLQKAAFQDVPEEGLPYFDKQNWDMLWETNDETISKRRQVPKFSLVDQTGRPFNEQVLKKGLSLAGFFFTACDGYCPRIMKNLQRVQKQAPGLRIYMHSVTPKLDTVENLAEFAESLDADPEKWHLLTGSQELIYRLGREVYDADTKTKTAPTNDTFVHSESLYLIDPNLYIRGVYRGNSPADINRLLRELPQLEKEFGINS